MQQVGAADDSDELLVTHHGKPFDPVLFHQLHDLFERRVFGDGVWLRCHDIRDLAGMRVDIFVRQAAGSDQKIEPVRPTPLRRRLGSAQEIAFRDDAEELSIGIDDRQAADFMPQHQLHGLQDRCIRPDRENRPCHDVFGVHRTSPLIGMLSSVQSAIQPAQRHAIAEHDPARAWQRDGRTVFEDGQRA